jgi:small basic protein
MPAVEWVLGLVFHVPVPPSVSSLVAGVVVAGVHAGINAFKARGAKVSAAAQ